MAKTDNDNDETPIEFEMPKWGLRGSRIPTPLNQPNWKYKYPQTNSKPDFLEKVFIVVIVIVEFFLLFQLFEFKNVQPSFYVFTAFWSLFTLISLLHFVNKESNEKYFVYLQMYTCDDCNIFSRCLLRHF